MAQFSKRLGILITVAGIYFLCTLYLASLPKTGCSDKTDSPCNENVDLKAIEIDADLGSLKIKDASKLELIRKLMPNMSQTSDRYSYEIDKAAPHNILRADAIPNSVFSVWCGRRWFEFHHYLSVLSVMREMRPDSYIIYYNEHPVKDSWIYNTWLDELKEEFPFFRMQQLDLGVGACDGFKKVNMSFVFKTLTDFGGMYINDQTLINRFPLKMRDYSLVYAFNSETGSGFISSKRGVPGTRKLMDIFSDSSISSRTISCPKATEFSTSKKKSYCVHMESVFFPKDIWDAENRFASVVRRIFYGSPEVPQPLKSYDELIPNIAHIVWLGGGQMDYLFYLCVLSLIYVAEVENLYIHGNAPPSGPLWMKVKDHPKIHTVYREAPGLVFGNPVDVISHVSDVWRVDFMLRYGGIYVDTDTIFVKKLDREIRSYDAVGAYDWTYWNPPFPDTINFGVAIGKRNAKYWHEFQKSMKVFLDADWSWNGLRQPYRIKERHPELVKIDPHLQVICYEFKCHPTWWPDYHNESIHHLNSPSIKDWMNDAYAFHFTLPTPPELLDEATLLKSTGMFAEIGKYVLIKAGLL